MSEELEQPLSQEENVVVQNVASTTGDDALENFIHYFSSLSENQKYQVSKLFNQKTGGKLSHHNNPTPVVVGLLQFDDDGEVKLLGVRRAIPPHVGEIALPGGFQDQLESPQVAVAREVMEETGLETNPEDYEIFGNPTITPNNQLLIFMKNKTIFTREAMKKFKINSEVQGFALIDNDTPICFPLHEEKVKLFMETRPESENKNPYKRKEFPKF